jgi:DNA-directed RNA polymerase subunit F
MIKEMKPLSLAEAKQLIEDNGGNEVAEEYLKKFNKLKAKDAQELRKEIEALDNHKIKSEQVVKIVDFLPEDASDVNKIFTDISLDDNEIKQVTAIVAKYK